MKNVFMKLLFVSVLCLSFSATPAYAGSGQQNGLFAGAAIGAAAGALIGSQTDETAEGAMFGAVFGAIAGSLLSNTSSSRYDQRAQRASRHGYSDHGRYAGDYRRHGRINHDRRDARQHYKRERHEYREHREAQRHNYYRQYSYNNRHANPQYRRHGNNYGWY